MMAVPLQSSSSKTAFALASGELLPPEDGGRALQALGAIDRFDAEQSFASDAPAKKNFVSEVIAFCKRMLLKPFHAETGETLPEVPQSVNKPGPARRPAGTHIKRLIPVQTLGRSVREIGGDRAKLNVSDNPNKTSDIYGDDGSARGADEVGLEGLADNSRSPTLPARDSASEIANHLGGLAGDGSNLVLSEEDDRMLAHSTKPIRKYADAELMVLVFRSAEEWQRAQMVKLETEEIRHIPDEWPDRSSMVIPKWSEDLHVAAFRRARPCGRI